MDKSESESDNKKDEIVLIEDDPKDKNDVGDISSSSEVMLTDEEFLLECARFGELNDLIQLLHEVKDLNVNYKDFRGNSALRIYKIDNNLI